MEFKQNSQTMSLSLEALTSLLPSEVKSIQTPLCDAKMELKIQLFILIIQKLYIVCVE